MKKSERLKFLEKEKVLHYSLLVWHIKKLDSTLSQQWLTTYLLPRAADVSAGSPVAEILDELAELGGTCIIDPPPSAASLDDLPCRKS